MLMKPTIPLLTAIMSLGASGSLGEIIKFVDGEREKIRDLLETTPSSDYLQQLQGQAQFAKDFSEMLHDAAPLLAKLKMAQAPP